MIEHAHSINWKVLQLEHRGRRDVFAEDCGRGIERRYGSVYEIDGRERVRTGQC